MSNVINTEEQRVISFCTGYGGLELGLRLAGIPVRTVCNVEIETFCQANLVAKAEEDLMDAAPIWTDLKTFPAHHFSGKVHGIIGGFPCQPFSCAGKQRGKDDPRHLWPWILDHIRTVRPFWCFFENVRGLVNLGLREVRDSLEELGYEVECGIFSAEETGAPHKRERIFILAHSTSAGFTTFREQCWSEWQQRVASQSGQLVDPEGEGFSECGDGNHSERGEEHPQDGGGIQCGSADTSLHGGPPRAVEEPELGNSDNDGASGMRVGIHEGEQDGQTSEVQQSTGADSSRELGDSKSWGPGGIQESPSEGQGHGAPGGSGISGGPPPDGSRTFTTTTGSRESADDDDAGCPTTTGQREAVADSSSRGSGESGVALEGSDGTVSECESEQGGTRRGVANTTIEGLERQPEYPEGDPERWEGSDGFVTAENAGGIVWPARPGQAQYGWEEPRTTKPKVGSTIDGFNARVDMLRLLGNGVVPTTAALAIITLMQLDDDCNAS